MALALGARGADGPREPEGGTQATAGVGQRFGDYELLEEVARGGMGIVYRARQLSLNRVVAVKVLLFGRFSSDEFVGRFKAEAELVAGLQHPNIVSIHEIGEHEGHHYFSMDFVEGQDLAARARDNPLPPELAADYLRTIAGAVEFAHGHGVLHRDLKPANVLIDALDQPRVTDFGLAKRMKGESGFSLGGVGTPNFAAPEQIGGKRGRVGPASDVYSLGAILYYLLTGRAPFLAQSLEETLWAVINTSPVAPHLLNPQTPSGLETICLKCLRKEPHARYGSAGALAGDLERWLKGEPILARRTGRLESAWLWCRRNRAPAVLACTTGMLLLALSIGSPLALLRIRSEAGQARERLNDTRMQRAEDLFQDDDAPEALAHLARVLRDDPGRNSAAARIYSALTQRNFPLPLFEPLAHEGAVMSAQFSPDGRRLLTASGGASQVWNSRSGAVEARFSGHRGAVRSARLSPDGRLVVTASEDWTARIWNAETGEAVAPALEHAGGVLFAQFSPNGLQVVTGSADGTARVWDAHTGKAVTTALEHNGEVNYAECSSDGTRVVTASRDGTARIWELASGKPLGSPLVHKGRVAAACFSPDGKRIVTASRDGTARVWNGWTGEAVTPAMVIEGPGDWAEFSPEGNEVVTMSLIATARVWDARTGQPITPVMKHNGRVSAAHFSPEGQRIVTASLDRSARVWNARTGQPLSERLKHEAGIYSAQFGRRGQWVLTASADKTARVWDARAGQELALALRHEGAVTYADFSPDGLLVATCSRDGTARVWRATTGEALSPPLRHQGRVQFAEFSPDGARLATASLDGAARIWSTRTGELIRVLEHRESVDSARFSPDGRRVATACEDGTAQIWDALTGQACAAPLRHLDRVTDARFSPDGRWIVTVSRDHTARIWDAVTGEAVVGPLEHGNWVVSACFSADSGRVLTASDDGTARIWDVRTGKMVVGPLRHDAAVDRAAFSRSGRFVVTASADRTARVWDAWTGRPIGQPMRHRERVTYAQFSADAERVATASRDGTARIWSARTGEPLSELLRHEGMVNCARFSPDGQRVVTASFDKSARVWEVPPAPRSVPPWLPRLAEAVAGERLTADGNSEPVSCAEVLKLQHEILHSRSTDFYMRWAQWFFADRDTRTVSPLSPLTMGDYVQRRIEEDSAMSLREAVLLSPTNAVALARLALKTPEPGRSEEQNRGTENERLAEQGVLIGPNEGKAVKAPGHPGEGGGMAQGGGKDP